MSDRQIWISRSNKMLPVLEEARKVFPDASNDAQALTRALFHWYHGRQENSKRGALDRIESTVEIMNINDKLILSLLEEIRNHVSRQPDNQE